jgi:hypothetical protein
MTKTILDTTVWLNFARAEAVDRLIAAMAGRCAVGLLVEQQEMLRWPQGTAHASQPFTFRPVALHAQRQGSLQIGWQ